MPEATIGIGAMAAEVGVHRDTLRAWANQRIVPSVKVKGRYRFRPSAVHAALDQQGKSALSEEMRAARGQDAKNRVHLLVRRICEDFSHKGKVARPHA